MNLNDFNRYAEDFEKKKGSGLRFLDQELENMRQAGIIDRYAQWANLHRQNELADFRLQQRSMSGASTAVSTLSSIPNDLGLNALGEMIPLRSKDE